MTLIGLAAGAQAQFSFNNVSATYSMNPDSGTINWIVTPDPAAMTIDFTQNAPAFKVGDSTNFLYGTSAITYDVTSSAPITSVVLTLQGDVEQYGEITTLEQVTSSGTSLGSVSDTIQGSSYSGGVDGAFTKVYHLDFSQAVTSFSVSQVMGSDIGDQSTPSSSLALVGTVEQNFTAVPEPVSLVGLALGAIAVVRRKRR